MKLTIEHSALSAAVSWAAQSLPIRPVAPVLGGLKLTAVDGSLEITAFDYEISANGMSPAQIGEPGRVLVSGRLLAEIVRALPNQPVTLSADDGKLLLTCGPYRYTLQLMPLDDFPAPPSTPAPTGQVAVRQLAEAVAQVVIAVGRDETLPFLTAIRLEARPDRLRLVATDRYRLAAREIPWYSADAALDTSVLIPARTLISLVKAMPQNGEVTLSLPREGVRSESLLSLAGENRTATIRLLDGEFIRYERIFPDEYSGHAVVETASLIEAVKGIALVAERNTPIRLAFGSGTVDIEAGSGEEARASATLDATVIGELTTIAANPGYLLDGLGALGTPFARIAYTAAANPAVLTGQSAAYAAPDEAYRYLFIPMRG